MSKDPLPVRLFKDGYDVYFYNERGSIFSRSHTGSLDADEAAYWDFDNATIGDQDVPFIVEAVINERELCEKVTWVGQNSGAD